MDRILEERAKSEVAWNVFQAPHHCSKSVMYWAEGDEEEQLKPEITGRLGDAALGPNRIVSSSNPVPESNEPGDNPPHAKAKTQYETITESFLCTMDNEEPIVARLEAGAIEFVGAAAAATSASESASKASGGRTVPASPVTYG
ncbi:MAG: hypothetical protein OXP37_07805 [Chloroflexota bacterium]|nr:hypothetical protein [Chloroflexota bacterium]